MTHPNTTPGPADTPGGSPIAPSSQATPPVVAGTIRGGFDTDSVGRAALPHLDRLLRDSEDIRAVALSTSDGIHVCSLGLSGADDAARISALNSSLFGIASAQARLMGGGPVAPASQDRPVPRDAVVVVSLPEQILVVAGIRFAPLGDLLLCLFAESEKLGLLIVQARDAAAALSDDLDEPESAVRG